MSAWVPRAWASTAWTPAAQTPGSWDAPTDEGVTTTLTLPPASAMESSDYRAAQDGVAVSTYAGAYLKLGETDYVWWSHGGQGVDPGLWVAELSGLTGHEVELVAGNRTGAQVGTATEAVVVSGWSFNATDDALAVTGPVAVTTGEAFSDRGTAGAWGVHTRVVDFGAGGLADAFVNHIVAPPGGGRVVALDVYLAGSVNVSDRPRFAIYRGGGTPPNAVGATLVHDFGQIPTALIGTNRWVRLHVPPDVMVEIEDEEDLYVAGKSGANVTQLGFEDVGTVLRGDFSALNLAVTDGAMSEDATVAWPATWAGDTTAAFGAVFGARIVYEQAPYRGDASLERLFGVHVSDPTTFLSAVDIDSLVGSLSALPTLLGMEIDYLEIAVGTHPSGEQFRAGITLGGDNSAPTTPDPDGAVFVWDAGQTTGTTANAWVRLTAPTDESSIPLDSGELVGCWIKSDNAAAGIQIRFAITTQEDQCDPEDNRMDWQRPTALGNGCEYEIFPTNPAHGTDPAVAYESPIVTHVSDVRPGNIPGLRIGIRVRGIRGP